MMNELKFFESLLGISGLRITECKMSSTQIILSCHIEGEAEACPHCGSLEGRSITRYSRRKIRDLGISGKEVWLELKVRQYRCRCGSYYQEELDWVEPGKSYTKRQAKFIFECCSKQPLKEVGALNNMSIQTVSRIYFALAAEEVESRLGLAYQQVRKLGIDEISHRKGRKDYCCVLTDLERGTQLDLLPDRSKETLAAHFRRLGSGFCAQIEQVCVDLYGNYIEVVKQCFPQARLTLDRFHIVQYLNAPLDEIRRRLRKTHKHEAVFKKLKWILYKQPTNLKPYQQELLNQAFDLSPELAKAYQLRNAFHNLIEYSTTIAQAEGHLKRWEKLVRESHQEEWLPFLRMLKKWKTEIINFVESRLTNAATEGLNNLIRYLKRISFGIPNFEHLRLRVLAQPY